MLAGPFDFFLLGEGGFCLGKGGCFVTGGVTVMVCFLIITDTQPSQEQL